jgi:hypothetical protein
MYRSASLPSAKSQCPLRTCSMAASLLADAPRLTSLIGLEQGG